MPPSRPSHRLLAPLVLSLLASGCQSGSASDLQTRGMPVDDHLVSPDASKPFNVEDEIEAREAMCRPRDEAISKWVDGFRHCERDEDCAVTMIGAHCAGAFLCPTVLNVHIDRPAFEREAAVRQAEYEAVCNCPIADCAAASQLEAYCNTETKLCTERNACIWVDGRGVVCGAGDSGAGDAGSLDGATADARIEDSRASSDAGASADASARSNADAGTDPFACQVAADCEIKNVGNCCGYYPRCVNKDAVFAPAQCEPGEGSVCGWPDIDECACRDNTCRSLQAGGEV
jgi:hypothetical protein